MIKYIITEPIFGYRLVYVVAFVCVPVGGEFFRAEYKTRLVAVFIVFYHGEGSKGLAETDAVSQNTAVELFKLADDSENSVALEIVEHSPDFALLEAGSFIAELDFIFCPVETLLSGNSRNIKFALRLKLSADHFLLQFQPYYVIII